MVRLVERTCRIQEGTGLEGICRCSVRLVLVRAVQAHVAVTSHESGLLEEVGGFLEILCAPLAELVFRDCRKIPLVIRSEDLVNIRHCPVEAEYVEVDICPDKVCLGKQVEFLGLGCILKHVYLGYRDVADTYDFPCVGNLGCLLVLVLAVGSILADNPYGGRAVAHLYRLAVCQTRHVVHVGQTFKSEFLVVECECQRMVSPYLGIASVIDSIQETLEVLIFRKDFLFSKTRVRCPVEVFPETGCRSRSKAQKHYKRKYMSEYLFHCLIHLSSEIQLDSELYIPHVRVCAPCEVLALRVAFNQIGKCQEVVTHDIYLDAGHAEFLPDLRA